MCIRERWHRYQSFNRLFFTDKTVFGFCRFSGQSCSWFRLYGRMLQMAFWFGKVPHLLQEIKRYVAGFVVFVFNSFQV